MRKLLSVCLMVSLCLCCFFGLSATAEDVTYNEAMKLRFAGDVDGDGAVTSTDARLILQRSANKIGEDDLNLVTADVDRNETVDSTDARLALQMAVGTVQKAFLAYDLTKAEDPEKEYPAVEYRVQKEEHEWVKAAQSSGRIYTAYQYPEKKSSKGVFLIQSKDEWDTFAGAVYDPIPAYDDSFFSDRVLLVFHTLCWDTADDLNVVGVAKRGETLRLQLLETNSSGITDDSCDTVRQIVELPRAEMAGIRQVECCHRLVVYGLDDPSVITVDRWM